MSLPCGAGGSPDTAKRARLAEPPSSQQTSDSPGDHPLTQPDPPAAKLAPAEIIVPLSAAPKQVKLNYDTLLDSFFKLRDAYLHRSISVDKSVLTPAMKDLVRLKLAHQLLSHAISALEDAEGAKNKLRNAFRDLIETSRRMLSTFIVQEQRACFLETEEKVSDSDGDD